jgi:transcriptional regulator with XRE-family HTH domain
MDRFAKHFGLRVKRARIERGLTQSELATLAAVGANYVPRIERGEMTPSVDAAYRLAQALGVSVDALCSLTSRADPLQDAARAVVSLTDNEVSAFKRAVQAVESLRAMLRGAKPPREPGDGAPHNGGRRASKSDDGNGHASGEPMAENRRVSRRAGVGRERSGGVGASRRSAK